MKSIEFGLRHEAAVGREVRRQQGHAAPCGKLNKRRVNVLVWEPLHQLVVAHGMAGDVDGVGDARGRNSCFFDAGDGFHARIVSPRYGKRNRL